MTNLDDKQIMDLDTKTGEEVDAPTQTKLCSLCSERFGEPSSQYKCNCNNHSAHQHIGRMWTPQRIRLRDQRRAAPAAVSSIRLSPT